MTPNKANEQFQMQLLRLRRRANERGGARLSFLMTMLVIAVVGYAASQYVPIAYRANEFKDEMHRRVDQAAAMGQDADWVSTQLRNASAEFDVPPTAVISAQHRNGRLEVVVRYTLPISLPGYIYQYSFDYTARSSTFLSGETTSSSLR